MEKYCRKNRIAAAFLVILMLPVSMVWAEIDLERDFVCPPASAKPHTWWHWMSGNVTKEGITADLEAMKRVGIGGFQAFHVSVFTPIGPIPVPVDTTAGTVDYMSDGWFEMMRYTLEEADRLDLEMCFHNCAGWTSSGGPWITPEYSMKEVVWSEKAVEGTSELTVQLDQPKTVAGYYRDIALLAIPTPQSELDGKGFRISDWRAKAGYERKPNLKPDNRKMAAGDIVSKDSILVLDNKMDSSGKLQCSLPDGKWTIIRFGYTSTGMTNRPSPDEARGLECDKLSEAAAELHWKNSVQKVIDKAGSLAGRVLNNILIDSYEVCTQNWTQQFPEEFERRMGYDLVCYLPALTGRVVGSQDITERFLWDFRRVISDMFDDYYFGHFAQMCHSNGMVLSIEPYTHTNWGGNFDSFSASSKADIPMGEWWAQSGQQWHHSSVKLASSAAHTYGRKFVGAEAFTSMSRFVSHPYVLKSQGDYFYCQGVNRFIFHTFVHQPWSNVYPGMTMGPYGFEFNRNNTWFEKGAAWLEYLSRCQYILQQGRFVGDLCYYGGEDPLSDAPVREATVPLAPSGYDYDFCTTEILFKMSVKNGIIVLPNGMQYRILVLPAGPMRSAVLRKVKNLVEAGAIVYGVRPTGSPSLRDYPACEQEIKELSDNLWDNDKIVSGRPLDKVLLSIGVLPDFEFTGEPIVIPTQYPGSGIEYIHRQIEETDVYFVSNQHKHSKLINAVFRVNGKQPELWNPETGQIEDIPLYSFSEDGRTVVPLLLEPAGSVFVVFREPADKVRVEQITVLEEAGFDDGINVSKLEIERAVYGVLSGTPEQQIDITENLRKMVQAGQLRIEAGNKIAGDPAYKTAKQMKVDYSVDGKSYSKVIDEKHTLDFAGTDVEAAAPFEVAYKGEDIVLIGSKPGRYEIQRTDGSKETINLKVSQPVSIDGPWILRFPIGWGAPEKIELDELIDWTTHEHYDVQHFSGTATYSKTFDLPTGHRQKDESIFLDLGIVNVIAEVKLNGQNMGILWKPPFRVNISDVVRLKSNLLEVEVTNLWPNRLIGDEKYPPDYELRESKEKGGRYVVKYPQWLLLGKKQPDTGRKTFVTWTYYKENDPLLPSGMLGPVRLVYYKKIVLK